MDSAKLAVSEQVASPATRSAAAIPSNIRRTLEESNLPIEVATAIADRLEASQPVGGEAGEVAEQLKGLQQIRFEGCQYGVISPEDAEKAAALIEKLEIERDEDRAVLMRHGFVRCDIPACNCGSWHPRFGLTERMQEIKDLLAEAGHELSNENGHLVKVALSELIAERDALKSRLDAPCEEVHKKLDSLKLLSIEAAYAELADYARDLYRKWQEANRRAEYWKAEHLAGNKALEAAEQRAAEAVARDSLDTIERVCFYEQEFYVLSNFSAFNLVWRNIRFSTSEAAYHWEKFPHDEKVRAAILNAKSAHDAFKCAEHFRAARRPDWDAVKVGVMREILRAKAEQHEYVRRKLLETGNRLLVENSWRDDFWGWGPNKDGRNMLGKLWMEIRAELRATAIRARSEGGGNG